MTLKEFWGSRFAGNGSQEIDFGDGKFRGGDYSNLLMLWYDAGNTSVPIDDLKTYDELQERCNEYVKGNVVCVKCRKVLSPKDGIERYFAGVYCKDCWTPQQEADRDWDYSHLD